MMSLAKILGSPLELVEYTQLFLQQPRDTSSSLATPYCQKAPKNKELSGFYQCQFESSSKTEFVGGLKVGKCGTIPFGLAKAIAPAGGWYVQLVYALYRELVLKFTIALLIRVVPSPMLLNLLI